MRRPTDPRAIRTVPHLRDTTHIKRQVQAELTPEVIAAYQQPWGAGSDRQSLARVSQDEAKTGPEARIHEILALAARHSHNGQPLHLPAPTPNEQWQPGQHRFFYDRRYWFVDGLRQNASGFSLNPLAVPEKWRLWWLVKLLGEIDPTLLPRYVFVADPNRISRRGSLFELWVAGFEGLGIPVITPASGRLQGINLKLHALIAEEQSRTLQEGHERAVERRQEHSQLFHKPGIGLRGTGPRGQLYQPDGKPVKVKKVKSEVWTDPKPYLALYDMTFKAASGELSDGADALRWLAREHGIVRSSAWLTKLFKPDSGHPSWLLGTFYAYKEKRTPKILVDAQTELDWEYEISDSGRFRYLRDWQEGTPFPIHYTEGTQSVPPHIFQAARSRVTRPGRPASRRSGACPSYLPPRLLQCAVCGECVEERWPGYDGTRQQRNWRMYCYCLSRLKDRHPDWTADQAKAYERERWNHTMKAPGCVSLRLWEELERILADPDYHWPEVPTTDTAELFAERERLERERDAALSEGIRIDDAYDAGEYGPKGDPFTRAKYEARSKTARERYEQAERGIARISDQILSTTAPQPPDLENIRQAFAALRQLPAA